MSEPLPPSAIQAGPLVLKKYGNRRLYNAGGQGFVTLQEVEGLLQRGTDVQIVDAKTGADLTKEVLVQIILDKESARDMLPLGVLKQIVRFASSPMRESFTRVLQDTFDGFLSSQRAFADAQRNMLQQVQQLPPVQQMQQHMQQLPQMPFAPWNPFAAFAPPPAQSARTAPAAVAKPPVRDSDGELDRLRSEMSQTQALLRQLLEQSSGPAAPRPSSKVAKKKAAAKARRV